MLDMIMDNVRQLKEQLYAFQGVKGSEEYKSLEEKFIQKLLILESIDSKENMNIMKKHKESIRTVNVCIRVLESKAQKQVDKNNTVSFQLTNKEDKKAPEAFDSASAWKIMDNVRYLKEKLSEFNGFKGSEEYIFLKEKFTEKLLALDR